MSANKVTYGFSSVHIALFSETQTGTKPSYETPIAIPGAVRFTPTTVGDSSTFYADNSAYFTVVANNGYTAEIEIALLPDELAAEILGWKIDNNGALIETADAKPRHFALMGQVEGDKRNRRFVYYDVQASRPAKERSTKGESVEVTTDVLNTTISPISIDSEMVVKSDLELSDTNATQYSAFFNKVYIPDFTTTTTAKSGGTA